MHFSYAKIHATAARALMRDPTAVTPLVNGCVNGALFNAAWCAKRLAALS